MFKEIIDSLFNTANNLRKKNSKVKTIANCPKCGNLVIESDGVWGCIGKINGTCNFSMGLDNPNETKSSDNVNNNQNKSESENQKEIKTQSSIDNNIDNNTSIDKNNYQNNTKTQSNTNDNLKNNTDIKTNNVSDNNDIIFRKGRKLSYKCSCGSDVYRYNKTAKCSNPKCNFLINTIHQDRNFSDSQLGELIGRRISPILTFTNNKNNQIFKSRVFIDFDENLNLLPKYKLVSNINQLNKRYKENLFAPDNGNFKGLTLAEVEKKESASAKQNNKKVQSNNQKSNQKTMQKTNNSKNNIQQKNIQQKNVLKKNINSNANMNTNQDKSVNTNTNTKNKNDYDYVNQDIYYQHYYNEDYTQTSTNSNIANDDYDEYLRVNNDCMNDYYNYYSEEANYQYSSSINYDDEPF